MKVRVIVPAGKSTRADSELCAAAWRKQKGRFSLDFTLIQDSPDSSESFSNPKVALLAQASFDTHDDWLVFADTDTRPEPHLLATALLEIEQTELFSQRIELAYLAPKVIRKDKITTSLELFIQTGEHAIGLWLDHRIFNQGLVGKCIFVRGDTMRQLGGWRAVDHYLAEDFMLGALARKLGFHVAKLSLQVPVESQAKRLSDVWSRHLRWARLRRFLSPRLFTLETVSTGLILFLGIYFPLAYRGERELILCLAVAIQLATLSFCLKHGWRGSVLEFLFWSTVWPYMTFALRITSLFSNEVIWRGVRYRIGPRTRFEVVSN